ARLAHTVPCRAYVIGDALYQTDGSQYQRHELEQMSAALGLARRTGFTGFVLRSDAALRALDIVVHASTEPEPFGLAIAEAMACGRAVVASSSGGASEIFIAGQNAEAHISGNAANLAEAITRLIKDPELRRLRGTAARTAMEQ